MPRHRQKIAHPPTERRKRVWQYRKAGMSYNEIAEREGVSRTCVWRDVQRVLAELKRDTREEAEEYRRVMIETLERLRLAHLPAANRADPHATDRVLRIMAQQAKLLGIDTIAEPPTMIVQNAAQDLVIDITPATTIIEVEASPSARLPDA